MTSEGLSLPLENRDHSRGHRRIAASAVASLRLYERVLFLPRYSLLSRVYYAVLKDEQIIMLVN